MRQAIVLTDRFGVELPSLLSVLLGPLQSVADPAEEQIRYLEGRASEPDLSDLDVVQELLDELDDALELAMPALEEFGDALVAVNAVSEALRSPTLGESVSDVRIDSEWVAVRRLATIAKDLITGAL